MARQRATLIAAKIIARGNYARRVEECAEDKKGGDASGQATRCAMTSWWGRGHDRSRGRANR
jgi:hypothetical protein